MFGSSSSRRCSAEKNLWVRPMTAVRSSFPSKALSCRFAMSVFFMRLVSFGRLESGTPYLSWPAMKCGGSRHQKNMCFLLDEAMQRDGKRRNRRTLLNRKGNRKSDTDTETRTKNRMPRSTRRLADEQRETS